MAVPTVPSNHLDTIGSDSSSRALQLTSRGGVARSSGWAEGTVRIGPSKTPNFLIPEEVPSLDEGQNPLPILEEEKDYDYNQDLVIKNRKEKQEDNIFEFNS